MTLQDVENMTPAQCKVIVEGVRNADLMGVVKNKSGKDPRQMFTLEVMDAISRKAELA